MEMGVGRTEGYFGVPIRRLYRSQSTPNPLPYALPERWPRPPTNKQHFCLTIPWRRKQVIIFNRSYYKISGNGIPSRIDKGLTCFCFKPKGNYEEVVIHLTPQQEERLKRLRCRMKVQFDASRPDHQDALRALWSATYPERKLCGLISDQWKEMGWQGKDPSTDFRLSFEICHLQASLKHFFLLKIRFFGVNNRGSGFISLENLLFFAKTFPISFQYLLKKQGGERSAWEYPFAVAGVNITFMIKQMLDLEACEEHRHSFSQNYSELLVDMHHFSMLQLVISYCTRPILYITDSMLNYGAKILSFLFLLLTKFRWWFAAKRRTLVRSVFLHMLSENEWAFDLLYCVAFAIMDKQWLKRNATYMEFNDILRSTRAQMEKELLMDGVLRIEDMPSYTLLT